MRGRTHPGSDLLLERSRRTGSLCAHARPKIRGTASSSFPRVCAGRVAYPCVHLFSWLLDSVTALVEPPPRDAQGFKCSEGPPPDRFGFCQREMHFRRGEFPHQ